MKRIVLLLAAFAGTIAATLALVSAPAAMAATGTPTVTTGTPTAVTTSSATLTGTVNLNGATLATALVGPNCYFEYEATGATSETQASCATSPTTTGSSTVTAAITGLTAGTTYTFTLSVSTGGTLGVLGTTTTSGSTVTFTTPTASNPPTVATAAPTNVAGTTATLNGTVNAEDFSLTGCSFSYTPSGGTAATASCSAVPSGSKSTAVTANVTGLTEGTAYTYTLTVTYGTGAGATTLTSSTSGSFITTMATITNPPSNLASTSATLVGTVDPEGQTVTGCTFYYGTSGPTLVTAQCSVTASSITGTSPVSVNTDVTGLTQKTDYIDTLVLTTSGGTAVATPGTFTTAATPPAPTATTTAATGVTSSTATLNATVDAGGEGIKGCEFEFGVNPLTSSSTPGDDLALTEQCTATPSDSGKQTVSVALKGLAPGTKYYYRLLFSTYGGYVIANTASFNTSAAAITTKPGATISGFTINKKAKTAKFKFTHTGVTATRGYQCALVTVTKGKAGSPNYAACTSIKSYSRLKVKSYIFYVRAGNSLGYGTAVTHRFTI